MPNFIRRAQIDDRVEIETLIAELVNFHGDAYAPAPDLIKTVLNTPELGIPMFVAERDNRLVSLAVSTTYPRLHKGAIFLLIHLFITTHSHRHTGIGRKMINHIKSYAKRHNISSLVVAADLQNEAAQQTYLKYGFKRRAIGGAHFEMSLL